MTDGIPRVTSPEELLQFLDEPPEEHNGMVLLDETDKLAPQKPPMPAPVELWQLADELERRAGQREVPTGELSGEVARRTLDSAILKAKADGLRAAAELARDTAREAPEMPRDRYDYRPMTCRCGCEHFHLPVWGADAVLVCSACGRISGAGAAMNKDASRSLRGKNASDVFGGSEK